MPSEFLTDGYKTFTSLHVLLDPCLCLWYFFISHTLSLVMSSFSLLSPLLSHPLLIKFSLSLFLTHPMPSPVVEEWYPGIEWVLAWPHLQGQHLLPSPQELMASPVKHLAATSCLYTRAQKLCPSGVWERSSCYHLPAEWARL